MKECLKFPRTSLLLAALIMLVLIGCNRATRTDPHAGEPGHPEGFVFHVAPHGSDSSSGARGAPFASLARARDAVRQARESMDGDYRILVAPGDYYLSEPLVLDHRDSGGDEFNITYRVAGVPGSARLIGGKPITGWESVDGRIFRARVSDGHVFHTLFENGIRAFRARFPNREEDPQFPWSAAGYLRAADGDRTLLTWKKGDLDPIKGVDLGENASLVVWPWGYCDWQKTPRRIVAIDHATRTIEIAEGLNVDMAEQARYYIQGAAWLLDAPGEFHLDQEIGFLYYWPRFGHPADQEIIAPVLQRVISIEGESHDQPVRKVVIEGFTIAFTDAFDVMEGSTLFPWSQTSAAPHGAVHLRYADEVTIRNNRVRGAGMNGIYLERSNKRNLIAGNLIEDSGVSGIVLAYHRQARQFPNDHNSENIIENNRIRGMGSLAVDSAGINIWGGQDNIVRHCEISDGSRYGISMRGPYTQMPGDNPSAGMGYTNRPIMTGTRIEFTRIFRTNQDSGDSAAMHMAGISSQTNHPVNYLEQLLIEDIIAHPSVGDMPPEGIYFDYTEGVTDQVLRNVEVRGTPNPFRTNRSDVRHVYDNVSWRDGFDAGRMQYDSIGLLPGFPKAFRVPGEIANARVENDVRHTTPALRLVWDKPDVANGELRITMEGVHAFEPVFVAASAGEAVLPKPDTGKLEKFRLRMATPNGQVSDGVLIPAAPRPLKVDAKRALGVKNGIDLQWRHADPDVRGFVVALRAADMHPRRFETAENSIQIAGLDCARTYTLRIDVVDSDGYVWEGVEFAATAGVRSIPPEDVAAWWTFDEILDGQIPDAAGRGLNLSVVGEGIERREGILGNALVFADDGSHVRLDNTGDLAIGSGDYSVSVWIRRAYSTAMSGRIFDFGGGTRGTWEHWNKPSPNEPAGVNLSSSDYGISALFNNGVEKVDLRRGGVRMPETWNQVVLNVRRGKEASLWVNGVPVAVEEIRSDTGNLVPEGPMVLGKASHMDHRNLQWAGAIDQLRIYRRALSDSEIADLFAEGNRVQVH